MEITEEQLKKIFELASLNDRYERREITSKDISEALIEIERKLYSFSANVKTGAIEDKKILIADDLELSIYQLTTLLKRIGISPSVARHKDEAVSEIQKVQFDCIIIDLFLPDSSDGLDLIRYAVNKRNENGRNMKIIVISGNDDKALIDKCYEEGTDLYIQKEKDWHTNLLKYLGSLFRNENNSWFSHYVINGNTVLYTVKKFNDEKIFISLQKDINSSLVTETKNVIFDLRAISDFNVDNAYIFAEIYKACAEAGGKFIILNPSADVKEALSFAYLDGIIPVFDTVEAAIDSINK